MPVGKDQIKQLGWIKVAKDGDGIVIQGFVYSLDSLESGTSVSIFHAVPVSVSNGALTVQYTEVGDGDRPKGFGEYSLVYPNHTNKSAAEWVGHIFYRNYPAINSRASRVAVDQLASIQSERDIAEALRTYMRELFPAPEVVDLNTATDRGVS